MGADEKADCEDNKVEQIQIRNSGEISAESILISAAPSQETALGRREDHIESEEAREGECAQTENVKDRSEDSRYRDLIDGEDEIREGDEALQTSGDYAGRAADSAQNSECWIILRHDSPDGRYVIGKLYSSGIHVRMRRRMRG